MKYILKIIFSFYVLFFMAPSFSVIQYKPHESVERHRISGGGILREDFIKNQKGSVISGGFLSYELMFPEIDKLFHKNYRDWLRLSLNGNVHLFQKNNQESFLSCDSDFYPLLYSGAGRISFVHFEEITPFVDYGLAGKGCFRNKTEGASYAFKKGEGQDEFLSYFSLGLSLSFKTIDKLSVYGLDMDYGINDFGLFGKCSFMKQKENKKKILLCEAGMGITF